MRTVGVAVLWLVCGPATAADPVPKYEGKPLGYWVERLEKATGHELDEAFTAVIAFGTDAAPAVPKLVGMLHDRSFQYRQHVLKVFAAVGPAANGATPDLIRMLKEKKVPEPRDVIEVLGTIGPGAKEAVPVLVEAFAGEDLDWPAFRALCAIRPPAADVLPIVRRKLAARGAEPEGDATWLVRPLGAAFGADAVPLLADLLGSDEADVRAAAAHALGDVGAAAKDTLPKLRPMLKAASPDARLAGADAVWRIGADPAAVPVLVELLTAKPDQTTVSGYGPTVGVIWPGAVNAARLLGEMGGTAADALPALEAVRDGRGNAAQAAADAIRAIRRGIREKR